MAKTQRPTESGRPASDETRGYLGPSTRPLHILAFVLPLVLAYEIGVGLWLAGADGRLITGVAAHDVIARAFATLGVAALWLPGAALVGVLAVMHGVSRDPTRLRPTVPLLMAVESLVWAAPLLVGATLLTDVLGGGPTPMAAIAPAPFAPLGEQLHGLGPRLTLAIGAGLYEEMLFRLMGVGGLCFVLKGLLHLKPRTSAITALAVSALLFAWHHDPGLSRGVTKLIPYAAAGFYFGVLYLFRGFGVVVGAHAVYDIVALTVGDQAAATD